MFTFPIKSGVVPLFTLLSSFGGTMEQKLTEMKDFQGCRTTCFGGKEVLPAVLPGAREKKQSSSHSRMLYVLVFNNVFALLLFRSITTAFKLNIATFLLGK